MGSYGYVALVVRCDGVERLGGSRIEWMGREEFVERSAGGEFVLGDFS